MKWFKWLNATTKANYGLEFTSRIDKEVEFQDILIKFDNAGLSSTDLFIKPTDARHYLSPDSCHTRQTFQGIVYS